MNIQNNRQQEKGFTLIELVIVIVILGIFAAVATPKLFKYANEATIMTAYVEASPYKTAVTVCHINTGTLAGCDAATNKILATGGAVSNVTDGIITVTTGVPNAPTILLTPDATGSVVTWVCAMAGADEDLAPKGCTVPVI